MRNVVFFVLVFFALLFATVLYYHNAPFLFEGIYRGFLLSKEKYVLHTIYIPAFYIHIITGSLVLVSGAFQLSKNLRQRYPAWHRGAGKFYVVIVLFLTAPSGFVMALYANGGISSQLCFALLASFWWYFTWKGWTNAQRHNWTLHRKFMLRSYVLTFAAVTLRLYSFLFALAGFRGEEIYSIIVWLSWIPSLIVIELWLRFRNGFENSKI